MFYKSIENLFKNEPLIMNIIFRRNKKFVYYKILDCIFKFKYENNWNLIPNRYKYWKYKVKNKTFSEWWNKASNNKIESNKITLQPIAPELNYPDMALYYTYNKNIGWKRRKTLTGNDTKCSTMWWVSFKAKERYYLSVLLRNLKGCTKELDLRTCDGIIYNTYKESASAYGLSQDRNDLINALEEASVLKSGIAFRKLFASILVNEDITNADELFERFKEPLTYDLWRHGEEYDPRIKYQPISNKYYNIALIKIEEYITGMGKSLKDVGFKEYDLSLTKFELSLSKEFRHEISFNSMNV